MTQTPYNTPPREASHAEAFSTADTVARRYFLDRYRDPILSLHARGWWFDGAHTSDGALIAAAEAGAMTQEQIRLRIQDYLRGAPLCGR